MKSKKAQMKELKTIILLLVVFVVLFFLAKGIVEVIVRGGSTKACELSVQAAHYSRGGPPVALQCETNFLYEDYKPKGKDNIKKKEQAMKTLMQLMYDCWDEFGQGQFNAFEGRLTEKSNHCFVCSKFGIKQGSGVTSSVDFTEAEFRAALKKEDVPVQKIKYYDFLEEGLLIHPSVAQTTIKTNTNTLDDPNIQKTIFLKKLSLDKNQDDGKIKTFIGVFAEIVDAFPDIFQGATSGSLVKAGEPLIDIIYNRFFFVPELEPFDKLETNPSKGDNYYAVVFMQIEKSYIKQTWLGRVFGGLLDKTDWEVFERTAPPAYVFVTKYDNLPNVGCEVLQG